MCKWYLLILLIQKRNTLLVSCEKGQIIEILNPLKKEFDTSHTFEITGLEMKTHMFKSVKSQLRVRNMITSHD